MGLGLRLGGTDAKDDRLRSNEPAGKLHRVFQEGFGATSCMVLSKGNFGSPQQRAICDGHVQETARLALGVIREK